MRTYERVDLIASPMTCDKRSEFCPPFLLASLSPLVFSFVNDRRKQASLPEKLMASDHATPCTLTAKPRVRNGSRKKRMLVIKEARIA